MDEAISALWAAEAELERLRARKSFRLVIVESPFAGDLETNALYLNACLRDCVLRGASPYASHGLLTRIGVLRDDVPDERTLGINAGLEWARVADLVAVYTDLGISRGMRLGIAHHESLGKTIEYRSLPEWRTPCPSAP